MNPMISHLPTHKRCFACDCLFYNKFHFPTVQNEQQIATVAITVLFGNILQSSIRSPFGG